MPPRPQITGNLIYVHHCGGSHHSGLALEELPLWLGLVGSLLGTCQCTCVMMAHRRRARGNRYPSDQWGSATAKFVQMRPGEVPRCWCVYIIEPLGPGLTPPPPSTPYWRSESCDSVDWFVWMVERGVIRCGWTTLGMICLQ